MGGMGQNVQKPGIGASNASATAPESAIAGDSASSHTRAATPTSAALNEDLKRDMAGTRQYAVVEARST